MQIFASEDDEDINNLMYNAPGRFPPIEDYVSSPDDLSQNQLAGEVSSTDHIGYS